MSIFSRILTIAAAVCCYAFADDTAETQELELVPRILKDVKLINKAKPNLKAKIYFVYQSRSKCGICVQEAPAMVKAYKKMKRQGCELVMLNVDANPEDAAKWVKKEKMDFPVIHPSESMRCGIPWEYTGRGLLPCMVAMTADGTKLGEAGGSEVSEFVNDWKKLLRDLKKQQAKQAAEEAREKAKAKKNKKKGKKQNKEAEEEESIEEGEDNDSFSEF